MACQSEDGGQKQQRRYTYKREYNQSLVHRYTVDRQKIIFLIGQKHHGHQSAQRHKSKTQHQLPKPLREHHRILWKPPVQQKIEEEKENRTAQAAQNIIGIKKTKVGVCHGAD